MSDTCPPHLDPEIWELARARVLAGICAEPAEVYQGGRGGRGRILVPLALRPQLWADLAVNLAPGIDVAGARRSADVALGRFRRDGARTVRHVRDALRPRFQGELRNQFHGGEKGRCTATCGCESFADEVVVRHVHRQWALGISDPSAIVAAWPKGLAGERIREAIVRFRSDVHGISQKPKRSFDAKWITTALHAEPLFGPLQAELGRELLYLHHLHQIGDDIAFASVEDRYLQWATQLGLTIDEARRIHLLALARLRDVARGRADREVFMHRYLDLGVASRAEARVDPRRPGGQDGTVDEALDRLGGRPAWAADEDAPDLADPAGPRFRLAQQHQAQALLRTAVRLVCDGMAAADALSTAIIEHQGDDRAQAARRAAWNDLVARVQEAADAHVAFLTDAVARMQPGTDADEAVFSIYCDRFGAERAKTLRDRPQWGSAVDEVRRWAARRTSGNRWS